LERRARVVGVLVDAVHEGRREARGAAKPTRLTAEGIVGAVLGVLHARLSKGDARCNGGAEPMAGLLGPLMAMIVLPYLGHAAAARETARPVPRRRRPVLAPRRGDPLRELDMRLTYRTVRVLVAIAALGGGESHPSNRQVSDAAGVSDQGQISKLLARLEHLGLIENAGVPVRGEPNAWRLTAKGQDVERTIRRQAAPA
jgi:DNA-binding MarR family transcriptional regulator